MIDREEMCLVKERDLQESKMKPGCEQKDKMRLVVWNQERVIDSVFFDNC